MSELQTPRPPAWPEKGTPEYEERLRRMREGHARRAQKAPRTKQEPKIAAPAGEPDLIDVGDPEPARMAPEARQDRSKPAPKGKSKDSEIDEPKAREYLGMLCNWLASHPGHEHWRRQDDELQMVTVPGVRCYNRLDKRIREQLQGFSDPGALVFGLVVIFGPSLMQELRSVQQTRLPAGQPRSRPQQQPFAQPQRQPEAPREADPWFGGGPEQHSAAVSSNGAVPVPVPEGIPLQGI